MSNKKTTKIAALIALIVIVSSVVWTWILVMFESYSSNNKKENKFNQQELEQLFKTLTWTTK